MLVLYKMVCTVDTHDKKYVYLQLILTWGGGEGLKTLLFAIGVLKKVATDLRFKKQRDKKMHNLNSDRKQTFNI